MAVSRSSSRSSNPWAWILGIPAALGFVLNQERQRRNQEALSAASLMRGQGTFAPLTPEQLPEQTGFQRFLGFPAPNTFQLGGNTFGFKPYETLDVPGVGKVPLTPEITGNLAIEQMKRARAEQALSQLYNVPIPSTPTAPLGAPTAPIPSMTPSRAIRPMAALLPPAVSRFQPVIQEAATETRLDPNLITAVLWQESAGDPHAVSEQGAQGLMQIMPPTQPAVGVTKPFDPQQSIRGGARYLAQQVQRFGGDLQKGIVGYFSPAAAEAMEKTGKIPPGNPKTEAYLQSVLQKYRTLTAKAGPSETPPALPRQAAELNQLNAEIERLKSLMSYFASQGKEQEASNHLNRLITRRDKLEDRVMEIPQAVAKEQALTGPRLEAKVAEQAVIGPMQTAEDLSKQRALTGIYADRARQELESTIDLKERLAQASREKQPVPTETTNKVQALMDVRESIDTLNEILSRRGQDPNFAKNLKRFTGPLTGIITQYFDQVFMGDDPDENDFVTALRTLQSSEVRTQAGLAQTGPEIELAIGVVGGRLPIIFNPPAVFKSRLKRLDDSIDRALKGMATNLEGRAYGQFINEYLSNRQSSHNPQDLLRKAWEEHKRGPAQ